MSYYNCSERSALDQNKFKTSARKISPDPGDLAKNLGQFTSYDIRGCKVRLKIEKIIQVILLHTNTVNTCSIKRKNKNVVGSFKKKF